MGAALPFSIRTHGKLISGNALRLPWKDKFLLAEFSLMPDHFHILLSVPAGMTLEKLIQFVKGGFSYQAKKNLGFSSEIWQRGFADQYITSAQEFEIRKRYIRGNAVAAKLVVCEEEYPYCSAHPGFILDPRPGHLGG